MVIMMVIDIIGFSSYPNKKVVHCFSEETQPFYIFSLIYEILKEQGLSTQQALEEIAPLTELDYFDLFFTFINKYKESLTTKIISLETPNAVQPVVMKKRGRPKK